jgi:DHA2 family multidrug resistance protein
LALYFYINIPLGIIATPDSKLCKKSKIWRKTEVESSRLARNYSSGLSFCSVLEHGQQDEFNNKLIVLLSAVSVFGYYSFGQLTYKYPIVNLSVLKDGNLRIGTFMAFILGFDCTDYINNNIIRNPFVGLPHAGLLFTLG